MSEMASKLHLKKELTQIRKAARVLRDPGTTSSWKSPLNSSRSASVSAWKSALNNGAPGPTQLDSLPPSTNKKVFLYNWKSNKSSREQEEEEEDASIDGSSSLVGSYDDALSDAHNACDSKSDTYLGAGGGGCRGGTRSSSIFRCGDSNLRRTVAPKKKSKKPSSNSKALLHLDPMAKFQHRDRNHNLGRKMLVLSRDDSVDHSDDTEDYSNSEDVRRGGSGSATSPLLLKLKRKNWSRSSSKLLRTSRKEDSSYSYSTPALSTSSYNRYGRQYPSTVGSWDGTTTSMNDGDDEIDDQLDLPGRQGCGIPCYWSKRTPKHRGMCGSCYSPSLSDTLRRKGSSILCGSQTSYPRHRRSRKMSWKSAQGVIPLLTNGGDGRVGSSIGTGRSDDELSTNFGELDLEGLSRLDGRRWSSSCRSQEGLEIIALNGEREEEDSPENSRSFSQKYRPIFFSELIGQNIVVQSLMNAVSRSRIATVYLFQGPRGTDADIVDRLRKISAQENLDVEEDALDLIATNADGSLRDAETMLEQLSLLGKRITTSLVNELVGVVSDEKLLELLELAMSSNTSETVKRARELMDSGVDPMVLMSQLAGLIMDIIAGSYTVIDSKPDETFLGGRSLNDSELERLKNALKLLSEAEKQLRTSSERSTWFTATLLQLGSVPSPDLTQSGSSRRQSCKTTEDDPSSASREVNSAKHMSDLKYMPRKSISPTSQQKAVNGNSGHQRSISSNIDGLSLKSKPSNSPVIDDGSTIVSSDDLMVGNMMFRCIDSGKLHDIWARCIGRCHSKTLRQLLLNHGKLVSICEIEGVLVAYVAFGDGDIKLRAERFSRSITNSMEMVLRRNVDVRIIHLPDGVGETQVNIPRQAESALGIEKEQRGARANGSDPLLDGNLQSAADSSDVLAERNGGRERRQDNPMQRIESIIREQRLETAWLQAVEKGSPGSLSRLRPEKNQVLPQDGIYCIDPMESIDSARFSSQQHWEDEQNNEVKILSAKNGRVLQKDQTGRRADRYPMSPSLLHDSSLATSSGKDNPGYESSTGAGGCGFLCWNKAKPRRVIKVRGGTPVGSRKVGRFPLFGECGKHKKRDVAT
ncbi:hypothetical protein PIB30_034316 [Stylosanthes scabra]|uniref:Protein STICHEL n=1 Tax=Stylosanthes scabra TaxID=79078 RepID=A0ABU6SCM8_9FABA|nr:hypothetical protein [Stylosanthes scabra]